MVEGIIIPADDTVSARAATFTRLEDYERAVGGWSEPVDIPGLGATLFVNESRFMHGLPFNRRATYLWRYHQPTAAVAEVRLMGNVVLVGLPDQSGDATDLPAGTRALLLDPSDYEVRVRHPDGTRWLVELVSYGSYLEAVIWACLVREIAEPGTEVEVAPTRT